MIIRNSFKQYNLTYNLIFLPSTTKSTQKQPSAPKCIQVQQLQPSVTKYNQEKQIAPKLKYVDSSATKWNKWNQVKSGKTKYNQTQPSEIN